MLKVVFCQNAQLQALKFLNIVITSKDTLDLLPGTYYYAIKIHLNHEEFEVDSFKKIDKVNTIINKTKLFLCD